MFLCKLGLHSYKFSEEWIPSIHAEIVTEYKCQVKCVCCGKIKAKKHLIWNGEDMVNAST